MNGIEVRGVTKQYSRKIALRDCTFSLPAGRVCGLVGANGAGKSTLLKLLVGLSQPTDGALSVFDQTPASRTEYLREIGYLAQDVPLYSRWSVADHLAMGRHMNPRWDAEATAGRLRSLDIPLEQRVGTLSGGQRAQVGLALALGKQPRLLLLDEPVAALDPLARREFLATLSEAVIDGDLTVILSSHLVADLERVCDFVIALADGRTVLASDLDTILAEHRLLTGARKDASAIARAHTVLRQEDTHRQTSVWVRLAGPLTDPHWQEHELSLEDIILTYLGQKSEPMPAFAPVGGVR